MAMHSGPYEPSAYDSLPSLGAASGQFRDMDAIKAIVGPISELFLAHQVHQQFGIGLLHKHFPIKPTERLVDYRNISAPWDLGEEEGDSSSSNGVTTKYEGVITPRSWRLLDGKFVPYEFEFSDEASGSAAAGGGSALDKADPRFLADLASLLRHRKLDQLLGLRALDQYDSGLTVEVTEGKMNIMIRQGIVPASELIEALWIFVEHGKRGRCHCREFCRTDRKGNHVENNHSCG